MKRKPTLRDTIAANEKALRGLCMAAGKPIPPGFEERAVEPVKQRAAPTKSDIPLEHEEQKNFVKWFRIQFPTVLIFAVPNAAMRDYKLAAYLRAEGMFAGIPDLHIPEWRTVIEMKRRKGSVISAEQYWCQTYYAKIGWTHFFAYGFEDAKLKLMGIQK
jgi:hypothetical protein